VAHPASDSQALLDKLAAADDANARGAYAAAALLYDEVAASSVDPDRRTAAAQKASDARARMKMGPATPVAGTVPPGALDQSGRYELVGGATLLGLAAWGPSAVGVYTNGPCVPGPQDPLACSHSTRVEVALYTLPAAASFFVPFLLTQHRTVTRGMASLGVHEGILGYVHGAMLYSAVTNTSHWARQSALALQSGVSLIEGLGGVFYAKSADLSEGGADLIGWGGDFGALFGMGAVALVSSHSNQTARGLGIGGLAGATAGYVGGGWLEARRDYDLGQSELVRTGGVVGAGVAVLPAIYALPSSSKPYVGSLMAGGALGTYLGDRLAQDWDPTTGQAALLDLGGVAGGLLADGVTYLVSPSNMSTDSRIKLFATTSAVGAVGGLVGTWFALGIAPRGAKAPEAEAAVSFHLGPLVGANGQKGLALAGTF
jgi:hypothetical protein